LYYEPSVNKFGVDATTQLAMPPRSRSTEDSDDDAPPEAVSLSTGRDAALQRRAVEVTTSKASRCQSAPAQTHHHTPADKPLSRIAARRSRRRPSQRSSRASCGPTCEARTCFRPSSWRTCQPPSAARARRPSRRRRSPRRGPRPSRRPRSVPPRLPRVAPRACTRSSTPGALDAASVRLFLGSLSFITLA